VLCCNITCALYCFILCCVHCVYDRIRERQAARIGTIAASVNGKPDKIGYVPRDKAVLVASGLTSAGMIHSRNGNFGGGGPSWAGNSSSQSASASASDPSQALDEESESQLAHVKAVDAEIDAGLDEISKSLDNITRIAKDMNAEVIKNFNIDSMWLM
jgi:hypothetical protein